METKVDVVGWRGRVHKANLGRQGSQGKRLREQGQGGAGGQQATEDAKGQDDLRGAGGGVQGYHQARRVL